ncbi:MAG: hypothetical protein AB7E24_22485 [Novosphingobium sp.]
MTRRVHLAVLAVAGAAALAGMALWSRWGPMIWITDFAAWCG